jgi:hypothetical protein
VAQLPAGALDMGKLLHLLFLQNSEDSGLSETGLEGALA